MATLTFFSCLFILFLLYYKGTFVRKLTLKAGDAMRTGTANLPLHGGKCPPWLFAHMKELAPAVIRAIALEYGAGEVLRRLADPIWFQAFGCLLGFDWHASGVTTTVCGAVKEGLKPHQGELGIFVAGGKGRTSRKTPMEIDEVFFNILRPGQFSTGLFENKLMAWRR